ncbi:Cold-shock DNA-binding domain protein [Roseimaritima multifibrata]|uniref:Cold-shock DNA-binding domain protein n=1 Tax=Roseimaritima multifibrata TaxID=1930274 RepID=A0A517MM66_9BACT|nr:cold shock domain-containing protein [Roseimaritima multifibrata]QDS95985.1 Cold-shock DNA-binding domain protein [Roseimaritima multifibrata]
MVEYVAPKDYPIQRRRLGKVKFVEAEGKFGFIDAEDFREDVFFHSSVWETKSNPPMIEMFVEFEIDPEYQKKENKLRATVVRLTDRPDGAEIEPYADPHLRAQHHPKARRQRPTWRNKDK